MILHCILKKITFAEKKGENHCYIFECRNCKHLPMFMSKRT